MSTLNHPNFDEDLSLTDMMGENETIAEENEPIVLEKSPYINDNDFIELLRNKKDTFKIISLNCQSLNAKFEMLKTYIDKWNDSNGKLDAICLQETWLAAGADSSLLQLPGYNLISQGKTCSVHGGVAIYIHEKYDYKILNIDVVSDLWDGQFLEINVTDKFSVKKKVVIVNLYRPPRPNINNMENFINDFSNITEKLRNFKYVIMTGDFNINLLNFRTNNMVNQFLNSVMANGYLPKVTVPTRLTQCKGTLIDNFFVKVSHDYSPTTTRVLLNQISDHLPCFISLDFINSQKISEKFIKICPSGLMNYENFKNDLSSTEASEKLRNCIKENVNDSCNFLQDIY